MSRDIGPLGRLGRWSATHRRMVMFAWVGIVVSLGVLAPRAEQAEHGFGIVESFDVVGIPQETDVAG